MPSRRSEATDAIWTRKTCAGERLITEFIITYCGCVLNVAEGYLRRLTCGGLGLAGPSVLRLFRLRYSCSRTGRRREVE
jgi:hypothetical protein